MSEGNIWTQVLDYLRRELDAEEFRRWLSSSSYASDSGDQITVWIPTAADGRHVLQNYNDRIQRALLSLGRTDTSVRFVATGYGDEDDDQLDD